MNLQDQKFGIELEFTGITRKKAASIVAKYFLTLENHVGGTYDKYIIEDNRGRDWEVIYDSSIVSRNSSGNPASTLYQCELVTPVCDYSDINDIQEIVRQLRGAKARVNSSCGLHVHVDGKDHTAKSLRNLINIVYSKEDMMANALQIDPSRLARWCRKVDSDFLVKLNELPTSRLQIEKIKELWYEGRPSRACNHYDVSRYRMANLHSYFQGKGVEFRCFNSTLHAGKVKAYIQFCLAISAQAINQRKALAAPTVSSNPCYTFRTWLIRIGLNGDEFKTCRLHMLNNLEGAKDRKNKRISSRGLEQRALELAADIEEERLASGGNVTATEEIIEQHRTSRRGTTIRNIDAPTDNLPPQALTLAERVDIFLASIGQDVSVSEEQRARIIDILTNCSLSGQRDHSPRENSAERENPLVLPRRGGRR